MAYYLVKKKGFKDSAAMFRTREEAVKDAERYFPNVPYRLQRITTEEAKKRLEKYKKRLKGKVPQSRIDNIKLP